MVKLRVSDIRQKKYCLYGVRKFFRDNNLDFKEFVKCGIECDKIIETGNPLAIELAEGVKKRGVREEETNSRL